MNSRKKTMKDTAMALALHFSMTAPNAVFGKQFITTTILTHVHHQHSTKYISLADF
jgi:hypothetical protein